MNNTISVMQPYIFPYLAYFQLIHASDKFVIYDDVNFISRGYINRNNILNRSSGMLFTFPVIGKSQNKLINEHYYNIDPSFNRKTLRTIQTLYSKAPYYKRTTALIENILNYQDDRVSTFNYNSIIKICSMLEIDTEIIPSSQIYDNNHLHSQERIIDICLREGANTYINSIGGKELYSAENFATMNINLRFLKSCNFKYEQFGEVFVPNLSIIDVLMFNSAQEIKKLLEEYTLVQ